MIETVEQLGRYIRISEEDASSIELVGKRYPWRLTEYYASLMEPADSKCPVRLQAVPHRKELVQSFGDSDPLSEEAHSPIPGVIRVYPDRIAVVVTGKCPVYCRRCLRKRFGRTGGDLKGRPLENVLSYIKSDRAIRDVLLTGGDPLVLATSKLENIIAPLREIEHVQIIRLGTRVPVFNPYRIIDDPSLGKMIEKYSTEKMKIYAILHFVHPKELTVAAIKGVNILQKSGAILANQTPLIRGLNDNPDVLAELLAKLSFIGLPPYYIFQCRPALGNKAYTLPIDEGYDIVEQAKSKVSGLAKRARYVMSHSSGKVEFVGKTDEYIYMRYHRAYDDANSGRFMAFRSNPEARWLDDYEEIVEDRPIGLLSKT